MLWFDGGDAPAARRGLALSGCAGLQRGHQLRRAAYLPVLRCSLILPFEYLLHFGLCTWLSSLFTQLLELLR